MTTIVLAIETSCDETGVGIARLDADGTVTMLADEVASSVDEHVRFGGVVPEIASRAHLEALGPTMRRALAGAGLDRPDIVAATIGPGLAGALLVGVAAAKAYSAAWGVPFYAVNHLGGHLAADVYQHGPLPESVALLVSGIASSCVGTMSGQVVMQGFIHRQIPIFARRAITMIPALVVIGVGFSPTRALVLSQVFLSFGIPFALIPLLFFTSSRSLMGSLVNRRPVAVLAGLVATLIVGLNVYLLVVAL